MMKITSEILDCHHGDDALLLHDALHDVLHDDGDVRHDDGDDDVHDCDDGSSYRSDDVHGDEVHLNI